MSQLKEREQENETEYVRERYIECGPIWDVPLTQKNYLVPYEKKMRSAEIDLLEACKNSTLIYANEPFHASITASFTFSSSSSS